MKWIGASLKGGVIWHIPTLLILCRVCSIRSGIRPNSGVTRSDLQQSEQRPKVVIWVKWRNAVLIWFRIKSGQEINSCFLLETSRDVIVEGWKLLKIWHQVFIIKYEKLYNRSMINISLLGIMWIDIYTQRFSHSIFPLNLDSYVRVRKL